MTMKQKLKAFFSSKTGKILPVILIALLIGVASSTVYTYYIVNATGTVRTPDLQLVAGTDVAGCSSTYPCATVTVSTTKDSAAVGFSLFPSATNTPQPATYYSNLTTVQNVGTSAHTISAIKISNLAGVAYLGSITVYYCSSATAPHNSEFNPDGTLVTPADCVGSATITSSSTGVITLSGGSTTLPARSGGGAGASKGYIEVAAYALGTATAGSAITFNISIQWL